MRRTGSPAAGEYTRTPMVWTVAVNGIGEARPASVLMVVPAHSGVPAPLSVEATVLLASTGSATSVVTAATGSPKSVTV